MNSKARLFFIATSLFVTFNVHLAMAQSSLKEASTPVRMTVYRTDTGADVTSVFVNDHYHTSLKSGSYSQMCFKAAGLATLAARASNNGQAHLGPEGRKASVLLREGNEAYVRLTVQDQEPVRVEFVKADVAQKELQAATIQTNTLSRVPETVACAPMANNASQPKLPVQKSEVFVLATDILFETSATTAKSITVEGRASLNKLIAHLTNTYGALEDAQIQVTAYTAASANDVASQRLSLARAQAVKHYMVDVGIASNKIKTEGRSLVNLAASATANTSSVVVTVSSAQR